jgi:hypothetical protein
MWCLNGQDNMRQFALADLNNCPHSFACERSCNPFCAQLVDGCLNSVKLSEVNVSKNRIMKLQAMHECSLFSELAFEKETATPVD